MNYMNKNNQIILGVIAAIVIIGGAWFAAAHRHSIDNTAQDQQEQNAANSSNKSQVKTGAETEANSDSDDSINQDMKNIDSGMSGVSKDNGDAQQSLNGF